MKTTSHISSILFILFILFSISAFAGNYTWTGSTSVSWSNSGNWSPTGVPSTNDTVTISNQTNNPKLTVNTTVKKFTINSGIIDLNRLALSISNYGNFNAGTINNGLLSGTAINIFTFSGTTFGAKVNLRGNEIYLNGSTFNDSLFITKTGTTNLFSIGGNTFNGYVSYINNSNAKIAFSDSIHDIFNATLIVNNASTGGFYIAHRSTGNQFNGMVKLIGSNIFSNYYGTATFSGDIYLDCPNGEIYFGYSNGSSTLISGKKIQFVSSISAGGLHFRNFTQSDSTTWEFALSGSAHLYFETGSTFHAVLTCTAPFVHLNGARFLGASIIYNNSTANLTSLGGCYFADNVTITNTSSSSYTYSLGNTVADTFYRASTIRNNTGSLSINNAVFLDDITFKNYDSSTTSDKFFISNTGACKIKAWLTIDNKKSGMVFGNSGGSTVLESGGAFSFVSGFTGNIKLKQFTCEGTNPQSFSFTTETSKLILGGNNTFNGDFTFYGQQIEMTSTTFNGTTTITKYGQADITCPGGNIFNSTTIIKDSSTSSHYLKLGNTSSDVFNGNVTFIQKSSGLLYPAYSTSTTFKGNITVDGTSAITFGNSGGKLIFSDTSAQSISNSASYAPVIKKMTVNKSSNSLTLNTPVSISDSLIFLKGIINADTTNLITLSNGGKVTGASDSSFVNGPFKKVGNAAFVFPVGKNISYGYRPVEITAPTSSTDAYTAQYVNQGQSLGSALDTSIEHLNTCEYWKLTRNAGSSKVRLKLNWNHSTCPIIDPHYIRIAGWNGTIWKDFGSFAYGGDSIKGYSTTLDSVTAINVFTTSYKRCIYFKSMITKHDVYCRGKADGLASTTVSGGTPPYKYNWSNGMGIQSFTPNILFPYKYSVSISDSLNCHLTDSVTISEPDSLIVSFSSSPSSCHDSTGILTAYASGGIGVNKNYFWTLDGETSQSHENLPAGEYNVLVTDSNGCVSYGGAQVSDEDGPLVSLNTMTSTTCFGGHDGAVKVDATSESEPLQYKWSTSNFDTLFEITGKHGGLYSIRVTDAIGCVTYDTFEIAQPDTFSISLVTTNTHCGAHEGTVTATVDGGNVPYEYIWSASDSTGNIIGGLNSGIDTITIVDHNGCHIWKTYEILDTAGLLVTGHVISDENCFLDGSGSARVTVTGGTPPYIYSWQPYGGENDTAVNLVSDIYTITVKDANGCRQKTNIAICSPEELNVYTYATDFDPDSTLYGTAHLIVYGGTPPYSYLWSTGSTADAIFNLSEGSDTIVVTDSHGCQEMNVAKIRNRNNQCMVGYNTINHHCGAYTCPTCTSYIVNIKSDFGAAGDGVTDDECAFEAASQFFSQITPTATKKLIIPYGTYLVGRQDLPWPGYGNVVLFFNNIDNITVQGIPNYSLDSLGQLVTSLPKMKFWDCMQYGAFEPPNYINRYLAKYPDTCAITNQYNYIITPGDMIQITGCKNVSISNLELDGNLDNIIIGGGYTDGIQIAYDGISINASVDVTLNNLNVHHFGHDGLYVSFHQCQGSNTWPPWTLLFPWQMGWPGFMNMIINNSKFLYNGRNAMTWAGGIGFTANNCEFSYTGQSRIGMKPYDGVDIEYENSNMPNSNGKFINCKFEFNKWAGMECNAGQPIHRLDYYSRDVKFERDTFVTSENGISAYPNSRNFEFQGCGFFGNILHAFKSPIGLTHNLNGGYNPIYPNNKNTRFYNCFFGEEYPTIWDNPLLTKTHSSGQGLDLIPGTATPDPACPNDNHTWLINFSTSLRVHMENCTTNTNFTLKDILLSSEGMGPYINSYSYNTFKDDLFYNAGLNSCSDSCNNDLATLYCVRLLGNIEFHDVMGLVDHNPNNPCIINSYFYVFDHIDDQGGTYSIQTTPNGGAALTYRYSFWGLPNIFERYFDSIDPHFENKLTPYPNEPCTLIVAPTYPTCTFNQPRMRNSYLADNKEINLIVYPNPSSDLLIIENAELETSIKICNIMGELIFENKVSNSTFQIDIRNLLPGIYIIHSEHSRAYKFIKI